LGEEGLDKKYHYLMEINLGDLETTSEEEQHYWLLQIQAARHKTQLRRGKNCRAIGKAKGKEGHICFLKIIYTPVMQEIWAFIACHYPR
jgi:hypothetical protein